MPPNRKQRRALASRSNGRVPSAVWPTAVMADMYTKPGKTDVPSNADRIWFLNNSTRNFRLRQTSEDEIAADAGIQPADSCNSFGYCLVRKIGEHRLRIFFASRSFRTEGYDDIACAILLEALEVLNPHIAIIDNQVGQLVGELPA